MELCLLQTQKKILSHQKKKMLHTQKKIVAHSKKKNCCTLKKKQKQISSKVLTLKTASGHQKKKSPRPGIEPGASA